MKRLVNILYHLLFALVLVLGVYMLVNGFFINHVIVREINQVDREHIDAIVWIILLILFFAATRIKLSRRYSLIVLFIWISIFALFSLLLTQSNPNDDSYRLVTDALKAYQNFPDYFEAWGETDLYYMASPWQVGLFLLLLLLNFVSFGHGSYLYIGLNIISVYVMFYYLVRIIEKVSKRTINWFCLALLLGLWIVPIAYIPYIYGWQFGLGLSVFGIYYVVCTLESPKSNWKSFGIALVSLFFACIVKTNYMIVFVAIILVIGMKWVALHYQWQTLIKIGLTIVIFGLSMVLPRWIVGSIVSQQVSGTPQINMLTMGTQEGMFGPGWFNGYAFTVFYDHYGDSQANHDRVVNDLSNRLQEFIDSPHVAVDFYKRKLDSMILTKDFQIHAYYNMNDGLGNRYLNQAPIREFTYAINTLEYALIAVGLSAGALIFLKRKTILEPAALFALLLCGGLLYHLLFEAKAIYLYPWITMALPLVYVGFKRITEYVNNRILLKYQIILLVVGSSLITGAALLYNSRTVEMVQYEQYSDDQQVFWLNQGNYIDQPFYLSEPAVIDSIQIMVSVYEPVNATIGLEIRDDSGESVFSKYYTSDIVTQIDAFISFDLNDLSLAEGNYSVYLYSDVIDDSIGLIIGNHYPSSFTSLTLNGYNQESMLNMKIIGKTKINMSYAMIYEDLNDSEGIEDE